VTWIPSHIFPEPNACFASLVWFITRYGKLGFVLLSTAGGLMILSAITIFVRLSTVNTIDEHQRIAASRMVYYLALGIVSLVSYLPFVWLAGLKISRHSSFHTSSLWFMARAISSLP